MEVERRVDVKRRISLPASSGIESNRIAVIIAMDDVVVVGKNKQALSHFIECFKEMQKERKLQALEKWEGIVKEAGLLGMTSDEVDRAVVESTKRRIISQSNDSP